MQTSLAQRAISSRSSAFVASPVAPVRRLVLVAPTAKVAVVDVEAKLKTRKAAANHWIIVAAAKRIKVTGSGKFMARRSGKQHMNEKQTRAQKRELSKSFVLEPADVYKAERCLPYAGI